jgi:hypothetical protein
VCAMCAGRDFASTSTASFRAMTSSSRRTSVPAMLQTRPLACERLVVSCSDCGCIRTIERSTIRHLAEAECPVCGNLGWHEVAQAAVLPAS